MASKPATKRLTKEFLAMQKAPPPFCYAAPDEKNILNWNFLIRGPADCPYTGGEYHGIIMFPPEYPFKPPGIKMYTPSGRFHPDKKICFSMSDFHPGTWNPAWSVASILTALLSFMLADETTTGSVTTTEAEKRTLASRSHDWNRKQKNFINAFPDYCGEQMKDLPNMGEKERGVSDAPSPPSIPASTTAAASPAGIPDQTQKAALEQVNFGMHSATTARARAAPIPTAPASSAVAVQGAEKLGWAASWRQMVWIKWRWGLLIALAVVVSRLTS